MSKFGSRNVGDSVIPRAHFQTPRDSHDDMEPFTGPGPNTFVEAADDQRLKLALRRAVSNTNAPQHLINSIREKIRES